MKRKAQQAINARNFAQEHPEMSVSQVARQFEVDRNTIGRLLVDKTNYSIDGHDGYLYYFDEDEMAAINCYISNPNITVKEVLQKYPVCSTSTFPRWIKIVQGHFEVHTKYNNNKNAFSEILTEEDAYWLGFITADGYVCEDHNKISLGLGEIDLEHLKKYAKYMGYSPEETEQVIHQGFGGAYTRDNKIYTLVTCGKKIVENLVDKGVHQRKSGKEVPYICSNTKLQIAYIRGLFDGDGYIRSTQYGLGLVGSLEILTFVGKFIDEQLDFHDEITHIHPHGTIYKYAISGRLKVAKILHLLYDDATIYLDRKYSLFKTMYCRE